jgi:serine/threonine protein kinase
VSDLPSELQNLSRFRVLRLLGAGGMGEVFLAEDKTLGRKVALKLLPEGLFSDPEVRRRFSQEARAVSALNHPQIITIYDIGAAQDRDFIAMEYVEGPDSSRAARGGPDRVRRIFDLVSQAASGLAAAHEAGIVYRDIKPENLMINRNGQLKIWTSGWPRSSSARRRRSFRAASRPSLTPRARPPAPARASFSERSPTCRPSRRKAARSITAPISSRWVSFSTRD